MGLGPDLLRLNRYHFHAMSGKSLRCRRGSAAAVNGKLLHCWARPGAQI